MMNKLLNRCSHYKKQFRYMAAFAVAWTLLAQLMSEAFYQDNLIYAIGEIHTYDPNLFRNNVYLGRGGVISPRVLADHLFALLMKWNGGNWADTALLWVYSGMGVQAAAIAHIAYRINKKYQIVGSAIFTCLVVYLQNNLAGFSASVVPSVSMGAALAFSCLAISFIVGTEKKYNIAWIFAGVASIFHIHEGIYCCVVIFMFATADCILKKRVLLKENICILVVIGAMALVTLPNMMTDKMDITNDMFVSVYSFFRHPHHLVPTSWGLEKIVKSGWINIFLYALSLEVFFFLKDETLNRYLLEAVLMETAWFGALVCAYLFTERMSIAFVSAMFLSKMFKYVSIVSMIFLLKAFMETRIHKLYLAGYLLLFFAFMTSVLDLKQIAMLYFFTAVMIMAEPSMDIAKSRMTLKIIVSVDAAFFFLLLSIRVFPAGKEQTVAVMMTFVAVAVIYFAGIRCRRTKELISFVICGGLFLASLYGRIIYYSDGGLRRVSGERTLINSMENEAYDLAVKFREKTGVKEEFIADPDDTVVSGWFQVVSERNCYVVYKVIPSAKSTIDDWYERYMRTQGIMEKETSEIEKIMRDSDIDYLLVKKDYFDKFDQAENMSVFLESNQDELRIYQLNEDK